MTKIRLLIMFLAIAGIGTIACEKEETADPTDKKALISKTWKISAYYDNGHLLEDSVFITARYTYASNGTYTFLFDGDTVNGTWAFNATNDAVIMDAGTQSEVMNTILELNDTSFKTSYTGGGGTVIVWMVPE